jgi:hypothetical protein
VTTPRPRRRCCLVAIEFPSGPGFNVFIGPTLIGAIGKHHKETSWWWQIEPDYGRGAGLQPTKGNALLALRARNKKLEPRTVRVKFPSFKIRAQKLLEHGSLSSKELEDAFRLTYAEGRMAGKLG